MPIRLTCLALLIALAACSDASKVDGNAQGGASYNLNDAMVAAESLNQAGIRDGAANGAVSEAPSNAALDAYLGKYPFDAVNGATFLQRPEVKASVEAAVTDPAIRAWIFERAGPQTPISKIGGRYASWGCEKSNCGSHNWTVMVSPDGQQASVCYLPDGAERPDWYEQGRKTGRSEPCPSES